MTFIAQEPPEFNSDHCKILRDFLNSETGQIAIAWVVHNRPALLDGGDVNKTLVSCGEVKGFDRFLSELISLTYEKPVKTEPENAAFPDLDNDAAWPKEGPEAERPRQPKS
jgi:hypothetical protein